jgi:hypothetical protein
MAVKINRVVLALILGLSNEVSLPHLENLRDRIFDEADSC